MYIERDRSRTWIIRGKITKDMQNEGSHTKSKVYRSISVRWTCNNPPPSPHTPFQITQHTMYAADKKNCNAVWGNTCKKTISLLTGCSYSSVLEQHIAKYFFLIAIAVQCSLFHELTCWQSLNFRLSTVMSSLQRGDLLYHIQGRMRGLKPKFY
jgi:hypothetical protein